MNFTVSRIQGTVPYTQYGNDSQKALATSFVKMNDKQISKKAYIVSGQKEKDNKFNKKLGKTFVSLPLIGGAAAATINKGGMSSKLIAGTKGFAKTSVGIGIPLATIAANAIVASKNDKVMEAEKKHPWLTMGGLVVTSSILYDGVEILAKNIAPRAKEIASTISKKTHLDKLAQNIDKTPKIIGDFVNKNVNKLGVNKTIKKISSLVPSSVKEANKKVINSDIAKNITAGAKTLGKIALKNPVTTVLGLMIVASVGHSINKHKNVEAQKSILKDAQHQTAKELITAYAMENDSLKNANKEAATTIEKLDK